MTLSRSSLAGFAPFFLLLLVACGGGGPDEEGPEVSGDSVFSDGSKVRSVEIVYGGLDAAKSGRFEAADGPALLRSGIESKLGGAGRYDSAGELDVVVRVDKLRIRNTAMVIFLGMYSGNDNIGAAVSVLRDGQEIKSFSTGTSTLRGGGAGGRTAHMLRTLSARIVAGL